MYSGLLKEFLKVTLRSIISLSRSSSKPSASEALGAIRLDCVLSFGSLDVVRIYTAKVSAATRASCSGVVAWRFSVLPQKDTDLTKRQKFILKDSAKGK